MEFLAREPALYQQVQLLLQFAGGGHIAGGGGLEAYLAYMAARLFACRLVLKETGSLCLHCDPTAGHYLKLLLDAIFGGKNFISQIVWNYGTPSGGRASGKKPVKSHELLLAYASRYGKHTYNRQYTPYSEKYVNDWFRHTDDDGRKYRTRSRKGRIIRQYLDESPGSTIVEYLDRHYATVWLSGMVSNNSKGKPRISNTETFGITRANNQSQQ